MPLFPTKEWLDIGGNDSPWRVCPSPQNGTTNCRTMDCLSNHKNGTTLNIFHNTQKIPSPWRPIRTVSASYLINISTSTAPTQPKLGHMQPLVLFTIRPNYYALSTLFLALRILFWHAYRSIPISHPKNIVI